MELKLGKCYKTRDGRKARVICDDLKTRYNCNFIALVMDGHKDKPFEETIYVNEYGKMGLINSDYDLVSEWIDKPEFDWSKAAAWHVAVAKAKYDRKWYVFDKIPEYRDCYDRYTYVRGSVLYCGEQIPDEHSPIWDGDIKDSLIIRPGYKQ